MQDYCWDEHGYSVLATFYPDLAVILDDKFRNAKYFMNKTDDSNSKLATAIWYYVQVIISLCGSFGFIILTPQFLFQCIFGVHYDDYNYQEIDQVLDQGSKECIQAWCNQTQARPASSSLFSALTSADKLQLSVILMEARFLSEMLFATQSVMKYVS